MNFSHRPGRLIWLTTQWPSLQGSAPEMAVMVPRLPRRSVRVPENVYSTMACSTKVSRQSCMETRTRWPWPVS